MGLENPNNEEYKDDLVMRKRRLREEKAVITKRSIEEYENLFGVKFSEMKGKRILDIGSGKGDLFEKASALGVEVISLNPQFKNGKNTWHENIFHAKGDVAGRAQEIPFADNSFDAEFALYSVPYYLPRYILDYENQNLYGNAEEREKFFIEEFERVIDQMIRTLKPGGKAYIYPINEDNNNQFIVKKILKKRLNKVSSLPNTYEGNRLLVLVKNKD